MLSYFDYIETTSLTLSESNIKAYDEIIHILTKTTANKEFIDIVIEYKNTNNRVFIYYVLYFLITNSEKNIKLSLEEMKFLIINCIDELSDLNYYSEISKLFKIN